MQQLSKAEIKRHQTNIKSGVGAYGIALIMTLVYLVKALIGGNFNFYFSNFLPELMLKRAVFTVSFDGDFSDLFLSGWRGSVSTAWFCVFFGLYAAFCVTLLLLSGKHPPLLWAVFALHAADTAALIAARLCSIPAAFTETAWIDIVFHVIVLLLLIVGSISGVKLPKDLRGDPREDVKDQIVKLDD